VAESINNNLTVSKSNRNIKSMGSKRTISFTIYTNVKLYIFNKYIRCLNKNKTGEAENIRSWDTKNVENCKQQQLLLGDLKQKQITTEPP
jgi:hypothetical protein